MLRTITLVFATLMFMNNGFAQRDKIRQSPRNCRSEVIERMGAEAARLGLRAQGDYTFQSVNNVLMVVVEVVPKDDKIKSTLLNQGGRTRLAYVESEHSGDLPNGFYLIQSSPELAKRMAARFGNKSGILEDEKVKFVSTDGRTTKEVSGTAMMYADPKYRHYWVRVELGSAFDPSGGGFWIDGGP